MGFPVHAFYKREMPKRACRLKSEEDGAKGKDEEVCPILTFGKARQSDVSRMGKSAVLQRPLCPCKGHLGALVMPGSLQKWKPTVRSGFSLRVSYSWCAGVRPVVGALTPQCGS